MRQNGFLRKFTCDEEVMCRLLYTDYLETLERRNDPNRRLGSIFCDLLKALLEKDYNLALIQAVCHKIQQVTVSGLYQTGMLVDPLIALLRVCIRSLFPLRCFAVLHRCCAAAHLLCVGSGGSVAICTPKRMPCNV
jgi:hypothetical protein